MQKQINEKIDQLRKASIELIQQTTGPNDHIIAELNAIDDRIIELEFISATLIELKLRHELLLFRLNLFKDMTAPRAQLATERATTELGKLIDVIENTKQKITHLLN